MRSTAVLVSLSNMQYALQKAVERYAQQLDAKQWALVGMELGKIMQIGQSIMDLHGVAQEALWDDYQDCRKKG